MARNPIAQTSVLESADTAPALMFTPVKAGLETMLQLVPSHRPGDVAIARRHRTAGRRLSNRGAEK